MVRINGKTFVCSADACSRPRYPVYNYQWTVSHHNQRRSKVLRDGEGGGGTNAHAHPPPMIRRSEFSELGDLWAQWTCWWSVKIFDIKCGQNISTASLLAWWSCWLISVLHNRSHQSFRCTAKGNLTRRWIYHCYCCYWVYGKLTQKLYTKHWIKIWAN